MKLEKRPILVTGGGGYIGSHTILALRQAGYGVVVLDNLSTGTRDLVAPDVPFIIGDVANREVTAHLFATYHPCAVIHFAGLIINEESIREPAKYYRNNAEASEILINSCVQAGIERFIFSSSAAIYGDAKDIPIRETATPSPITPYGRSKLMTEDVLAAVAAETGLRFTTLRYFNAAGADEQGRSGQISKIASHLIKVACEAAVGKRSEVAIFGTDYPTPDGTCIRDYIHVSDLASAHVAALQRLLSGGDNLIANVGYGRGYSVREVLSEIKAIIPDLIIREAPRRPGDVPQLVADNRLIRAELEWQPRYDDLRTIIRSALAWEQTCRTF
jgi:UDP-glucose 4-epimerase